MTAITTSAASHTARTIAEAASTGLAPGTTLNVGEAQTAPVELNLQYAVLCGLGGTVSGEVALFVDDEFARALVLAETGELDLAQALAPTLAAVAGALGSVILGDAVTVDGRMAQSRIEASADMAVVALDDGVAVRAAVSVGMASSAPTAASPAAASGSAAAPGRQAERLDLLRNVEMATTVELGRTRMTINDLLSLREGAVIELDRAAGDTADLFVNGRLIAHGEIVVVGENYGLRVTEIVSDEPTR